MVLANLDGYFNVFERSEIGHQIIKLKYETNVVTAVVGKSASVKRSNVLSVEDYFSFRRGVHSAEKIQKRGLTRARRT